MTADRQFQFLVLSGIWMLARIIVNPKRAGEYSINWRMEALYWQEKQSPDAKKVEYRDTTVFPIITNS